MFKDSEPSDVYSQSEQPVLKKRRSATPSVEAKSGRMLNKEVKVDQIIANPYEPTKDEPTEPEVASTTKSE